AGAGNCAPRDAGAGRTAWAVGRSERGGRGGAGQAGTRGAERGKGSGEGGGRFGGRGAGANGAWVPRGRKRASAAGSASARCGLAERAAGLEPRAEFACKRSFDAAGIRRGERALF